MTTTQGLRLIVAPNVGEVVRLAGNRIQAGLRAKPQGFVLGTATGGTMEPLYAHLAWRETASRMLDVDADLGGFEHVSLRNIAATFGLDEYFGVPQAFYGQTYRAFMELHLFSKVGLSNNTHLPDWRINDPEQARLACQAYEELIRSVGGIDLQLLGLGGNGHIAFNEPFSSFASRTRLIGLDRRTVVDNARYFLSPDESRGLGVEPGKSPYEKMVSGMWTDRQRAFFELVLNERVPNAAMTMGIGTILEARALLMLVTGAAKRAALHAMLFGPITEGVPATSLRTHSDALVLADREAIDDEVAELIGLPSDPEATLEGVVIG